jgi:hypothetical protein
MDEVDFTILAATSVLGDMIDKCPPAETCRDAFDRMSKATVQMCMSTTGFASSGQGLDSRSNIKDEIQPTPQPNPRPSRPKPHFDMSLTDLLRTSPPQPAPSRLPANPDRRNDDPSSAYQDPETMSYTTASAAGATYPDFTSYTATDTDMGFLPGWTPDLQEGFAHGLGWESGDHDFSEGGGGGLPDLFEGFYFGGSGNL